MSSSKTARKTPRPAAAPLRSTSSKSPRRSTSRASTTALPRGRVYVDLLVYDDFQFRDADAAPKKIEKNMNIKFNNRASDSPYIYDCDTYRIEIVFNKITIKFKITDDQYIQDIVKKVYLASKSKLNSFTNKGGQYDVKVNDNIVKTFDAPYAKRRTNIE